MEKQIALIPAFDLFILESIKGKRRNGNGEMIKSSTIEQYQTVRKYLKGYEAAYNLHIRILISSTLSQKYYLKERTYWLKFKKKLELYLRKECHCFDVYIAAVFKIVRTFFNYLRGEKGHRISLFNKVFNCQAYSYQPIILDINQLKALIETPEIRQQLNKSQCRCLDMFIVGCAVGLRFGDLVNIRQTNVRKIDNYYFLEVSTKKTGSQVIIPLPPVIISIILRQRKQKDNRIFERISNTNFNLNLKKIMELAGFTEVLPKYRHQNGKLQEVKTSKGESFRLCDHISSHSMRRIAITSLLSLGVPEQIVRKYSGHAAGSKEFYRYVTLAQDYSNREIANAHAKLFE